MTPLAALLAALEGVDVGSTRAHAPPCARCSRPVLRVGALCAECEHAQRRERRQAALGPARMSIPPAFRPCGPSETRRRANVPAETLDHAYASIVRRRVVLLGASGYGKTTLACSMLERLIDRGVEGSHEDFVRARGAFFVDSSALCRAVRDHPFGAGDAPLLERAMRATVLVLDDLGQELTMRMACNPVVEVIRERHAHERATWVTTFLALPGIEKAYGSGTARRVCDGATVLELAMP